MHANDLIDDLARRLGTNFLVVRKPQDPYLFAAPDLLVADYGRLAAIFIPKALETKVPEQLLIRLAVARIAFPIHLRCLLLLSDRTLARGLLEKVQPRFHATVDSTDFPRLESMLRHWTFDHDVPPVTLDVRQRAFDRAELCFAESVKRLAPGGDFFPTKLRDRLNIGDYDLVDIPRWLEPERASVGLRSTTQVLEGPAALVAAITFNRPSFELRELKPYCEAGVALEYMMENDGDIYPRDFRPKPRLLLVNKRPQWRTDPDKPLRAAAFAGWTLLTAQSRAEIEECARDLSAAFRRI
jgi:hypothetical protein